MRLDIVIPAHNEEQRIGRMLAGYRSRLRDSELRFIVALDACTDDTEGVVRDQMHEDGRVDLLPLPKLGKGGVIREAFARSDAELVGFVDADGATPPSELLRLAEATEHADGAIASRRHPAAVLPVGRSVPRRLTSAGFAMGVRTLLRLPGPPDPDWLTRSAVGGSALLPRCRARPRALRELVLGHGPLGLSHDVADASRRRQSDPVRADAGR